VGDYGLLREADFVREKEERGWTELPKKIRSPGKGRSMRNTNI